MLTTLDMVVLKESSLVISLSKNFLADLKISIGLLECFMFDWFCIFCLPNILQKVLDHFSHRTSYLILAQTFRSFDCLRSPWCNFACKFSIVGLNSRLRFSCKVLGLYLRQEILIFACKVQVLEKDRGSLFSAGFCILQQVTCEGVVIFHIFKLKK